MGAIVIWTRYDEGPESAEVATSEVITLFTQFRPDFFFIFYGAKDQAQASDQFLATTKLATNKAICLKKKKIRAKCTFKDF